MLRLPPSIITSRARKLALPPGGRGELSTLGGQSRAIPPVQLVSTPPNTSLAARSCLLGRDSGRLPGISHQVSPKPPEGDLYASARCLTRRFLRLGHETTPGPQLLPRPQPCRAAPGVVSGFRLVRELRLHPPRDPGPQLPTAPARRQVTRRAPAPCPGRAGPRS